MSINKKAGNSFQFTIEDGQIGGIRTGEKISDAMEKLKQFRIIMDSLPTCAGCTTYSPIYKITNPQIDTISFTIEPGWEEENKNNVFRIRTSDERFVTDKGVNVG